MIENHLENGKNKVNNQLFFTLHKKKRRTNEQKTFFPTHAYIDNGQNRQFEWRGGRRRWMGGEKQNKTEIVLNVMRRRHGTHVSNQKPIKITDNLIKKEI